MGKLSYNIGDYAKLSIFGESFLYIFTAGSKASDQEIRDFEKHETTS